MTISYTFIFQALRLQVQSSYVKGHSCSFLVDASIASINRFDTFENSIQQKYVYLKTSLLIFRAIHSTGFYMILILNERFFKQTTKDDK